MLAYITLLTGNLVGDCLLWWQQHTQVTNAVQALCCTGTPPDPEHY